MLYKKEGSFFCWACAAHLHCKYIRPHYDGTLAIHRSSTTIPCRFQLQCSIWKVLIWNSKISSKVIVGSQFRYTWSITILDCNVYNESNLTSYYQSLEILGLKSKFSLNHYIKKKMLHIRYHLRIFQQLPHQTLG